MENWIINYIKKIKSLKLTKSPKIINKNIHKINNKDISYATKKIISKLNEKGFEAYLVGGAVRDLIIGINPKDFDIVTNAYPEQIKKIFEFSRIIGRRFKIVHVHANKEIIEVSTFRSFNNQYTNKNGKILKDNQYGNINQDTFRRDFTCNAIYYDLKNEILIDFHDSINDIKRKNLLIIGNINKRFKEDPIRILRAIRFSAKLDFNINKNILKSIIKNSHLITLEPKARVFDELLKIFKCGKSVKCIEIIQKIGIQNDIHPILNFIKNKSFKNSFEYIALKESDYRIQNNNHISIGFIIAILIWKEIKTSWDEKIKEGEKSIVAINESIKEFQINSNRLIAIPKNITYTAFEIIRLQSYLNFTNKNKPFKLIKNPKFKPSYDFLSIRTSANELSSNLYDWWTKFLNSDAITKNKMTMIDEKKNKTIHQISEKIVLKHN